MPSTPKRTYQEPSVRHRDEAKSETATDTTPASSGEWVLLWMGVALLFWGGVSAVAWLVLI